MTNIWANTFLEKSVFTDICVVLYSFGSVNQFVLYIYPFVIFHLLLIYIDVRSYLCSGNSQAWRHISHIYIWYKIVLESWKWYIHAFHIETKTSGTSWVYTTKTLFFKAGNDLWQQNSNISNRKGSIIFRWFDNFENETDNPPRCGYWQHNFYYDLMTSHKHIDMIMRCRWHRFVACMEHEDDLAI